MIYKLPTLKLADNKIERETAIKFLEVMLDEKISNKTYRTIVPRKTFT